jgi:hypothetical protein
LSNALTEGLFRLVGTGNSIPRNIREIEISRDDRKMSFFHGSNFIKHIEKGVEFR